MSKIVACANQKGGVGKTTSAVNLVAALASLGQRALLVDLDPQGNATTGSGIDKNQLTQSITDVLLGDVLAGEAIVKADPAGYHLLPANGGLTSAEIQLLQKPDKEWCLKRALSPLSGEYDYIIIDCPPSLNMLTVNALVAADSVLIPMQCEYYALEGLSALLETIESLRGVNPALKIEGILRTMYDPRNRLTKEVSEQLTTHFSEALYHTVIPRNVRLAEAPSYGMPISLYDKKSQGAAAYLALAGEFLRRNDGELVEKRRDAISCA